MKRISIFLFSFIFISSIIAGGNPSKVKPIKNSSKQQEKFPTWISNPSQNYNEKLYLTGVGFGTNDNTAEDDAKSELIKILDQKISSTESIKNTSTTTEEFSSYTANIDTSSQLKSITGLKIAEKFYANDSKVYALAVLKRQDVADYYSNLISKNNSQIIEYINFANSNLGTLESCIYAQQAFLLGQENEYYSFLINTIDAPFEPDYELSYGSFVQLSKKVSDIKKNVSINIQVSNDEKNRIKNSLIKTYNTLGIQSSDLATCKYTVIANVSIEKTDSPDKKHVYYNYFYTLDLIDVTSQTTLHSYSTHGRVGHLNDQGALNKTFITISSEIEKKYYANLNALLSANK